MLNSLFLKYLELLEILKIDRSVELATRQSRELFVTSSNVELAAALHTAGDIRAGASLQSGDWSRPLHDRFAGLRRVHLLHDAGENIVYKFEYRYENKFFEFLNVAE